MSYSTHTFFKLYYMKLNFYFSWQLGLMLSIGRTFEKRPYLTIEIPFLIIQICGFEPKK